jgi:hypothetical protein
MGGIGVARIAKVCALFGFFLPWVLVSCSTQPVASISGLSLAMGDMAAKNPVTGTIEHQHTSPNLFLLLSLLAIAGALALSFRGKDPAGGSPAQDVKQTARTLCIGAAVAAVLSVIGLMTVYSERDQAIAKAQAQNQFGGGMAGVIQIHTRYGFWVTLLSLAVAAGASGLIITDRESLLETFGSEARRLAAAASAAGGGRDDDERYWDRLGDKTDPTALEEYLHRFPQGRFASLARARLERSGAPYVEAPPPAQTAQPVPETRAAASPPAPAQCRACGAAPNDGDRFCSACGATLAA